ncbi:hypothetical protein ACH4GZ_04545 [Streptomyces hygroscopicus]|uniref:hypothetical protein n=1 Tax=Streptomyces TaxID=1883 RepID=UPI000AEA2786|nr:MULTISPECIES: hypothetical protein [Streptomyces]MCO8305077.1 hypothetical protein [Streptomyces sp. RKCA744]
MTAGRGDRAAPPAPDGHWEVRFADAASAKGWDNLAQQARENTYRAWIHHAYRPQTGHRDNPAPPPQGLAHGTHRGQTCEQWQIEVTGGGRIWYLLDAARETCWITFAGTGHPRATDRR